ASQNREQKALGEQLSQHPGSICTDRHPDADLARTGCRARELKIGHVGAGYQEEKTDRSEQESQAGTHLATRHRDVEVVPASCDEPTARKVLRVLLCQTDMECVQLLLRRVLGDAWLKPHDSVDHAILADVCRKR